MSDDNVMYNINKIWYKVVFWLYNYALYTWE